jgi:uncharacterized protein YjbJ (UPF0337 family)
VKQAIGKATGDAKLQTDGKADKIEGKVQNAISGVNDAVRVRCGNNCYRLLHRSER